MKFIRVLLIIIASTGLSFSYQNALAQSFNVYGSVADTSSARPLEFVTVNLTSTGNTEKVTYTKADGSFGFKGLKPVKYLLTINYMGYHPKKMEIDLTKGIAGGTNLGNILIRRQQKQLKEVSIQSSKQIIKQEADRIVYDLQADPDSKGSNMLEMMRKVPYLSVDANENILLKGGSDYKIFVNGRPSGMMASNPKAILKSMPASTIQRIEVITNPSSKYDAEGLAGIINIVTRKTTHGYNGALNMSGGFPTGGPGAGGSFSAKSGKFDLSVYTGAAINKSPAISYQNSRAANSPVTRLTQNGQTRSDSRTEYFGSEISYEVDSLDLISAQFNINASKTNGLNSRYSVLNSAEAILQNYNLVNDQETRGSGLDAGLNYQLGFKTNKNRLLTVSYHYSRYSNHLFNELNNHDHLTGLLSSAEQTNRSILNEQTFQVDYVHLVKKVNIESGVKAIFRDNVSDFQYSPLIAGVYQPEPDLSNTYTNNQLILAAYNTYRFSVKSWDLNGGLRLERTTTNADFISTVSQVRQSYFNLVPSVSVNKNFKDKSSLNLGFSQRIKRPGINRLNPFVDRSNPNFESGGNPGLRASVMNNIQMAYSMSRKLSVNAGLTYVFVKDLELLVSSFNPATNITYITYQNLGKGNGLTANLNISYPFTKALNMSVNSNITYLNLEGMNNGTLIRTNHLSENVFLSTSCRLNNGWRLSANLQYNGRNQVSLQSLSNPMASILLGVNKDIIKNKLSFSASVSNPFTKFRNNELQTTGDGFIETEIKQEYFRAGRLSLNYSFGKLKEAARKNKRGIKNDDLSN